MEYWKDFPPAHVILAAVHFKKKSPKPRRDSRTPVVNQIDELQAEISRLGLGTFAGKLPDCYKVN